MTRIITSGAESGEFGGTTLANHPDPFGAGGTGTAPIVETVHPRSGIYNYKIFSTTAGSYIESYSLNTVSTQQYFLRVYFWLVSLPTTFDNYVLLRTMSAAAGVITSVVVDEFGIVTIVGGTNPTGTQAFVTGDWNMFEFSWKIDTANTLNSFTEVKVSGEVQDSVVGGTTLVSKLRIGKVASAVAGPGTDMYLDDIALDDIMYPGEGKIILLKPISDNARGSWTGGAGGTTNLFEAINNTPPLGTATETDTTQIENTVSGATAPNGDFNCPSYIAAGMGIDDAITLLCVYVNHGEDIATGTKTGNASIASNPGPIASTPTFNFGDDVGALATYPTNWSWAKSSNPVQWNGKEGYPGIDKKVGPVVRITKTDTGTRVASCDFLGIICEYRPRARVSPITHSEGMSRARSW